MAKAFKVGIIGRGFGQSVIAPATALLPQVALVGVVGRDSWRELLAKVDIAIVVTPNATHYELVTAALEAKKHVICEKPFGTSVSQAKQMLESAQRMGVTHAVDFEFRYEPSFLALRRELSSLGKLQSVSVDWRSSGARKRPSDAWQNQLDAGGGVLESHGSHALDYLRWLSGAELKVTKAQLPDPAHCKLFGFLGQASLQIAIDGACETGIGHSVEFRGSGGVLRAEHAPPFTRASSKLWRDSRQLSLGNMDSFPGDSRVHAVSDLLRDFIGAIEGGASTIPTFADGLWTRQKIAEALNSVG